MINLFKRKKKIVFTILDVPTEKGSFMISVQFKGDVIDAHILGIKQFIDNQVNQIVQAKRHEKKKGKKNG